MSSSPALLIAELQSLATETKRKYSDVREAAERSVAIIRSLQDKDLESLAADGARSEDLLRPVFMGCSTKNAKVIAIALGSLQRLITLRAVPQAALPSILSMMGECMNQGVDIQLKILQTLLSLITNFPSLHGSLLGDSLLLCFRMQESRITVVSSTAAATLRQLVMFVFDKVVDEDLKDNVKPNEYTEVILPDGTRTELGPSALDAYSVLEDLCLLANSEKPHFLNLGSLPKTSALELIESVLTNYYSLFRQHTGLPVVLQHHLCPLLLRLMSERLSFPLMLRSMRVVFFLLKQFSDELMTEAEVFLALLIKIIAGESDLGPSDAASRPLWMRVLAMEIIRGLCNDADLMCRVWERYDSHEGGTKLFGSLISVLKRVVTEKPALLGVSSQILGIGVMTQSETGSLSSTGSYGLDVGTVAGIVATAASATVTNVVGMMGSEQNGLSMSGSAMKLQCIDQLDKADAPPIPESYIYLLSLQCLVSISEGFAALTLPLFNAIAMQRSRAASENMMKIPQALDVAGLPEDQPSTKVLRAVYGMVENGWPGLLAALSFLVATNLSNDLFGDVLQSYQNMANVSGMLGLSTPRDAFLTSLSKFAIPSRVLSNLDTYTEPATPRSTGALQESFGVLTSGTSSVLPGLSDRNLACLKVLISSALFLAGALGHSWYHILGVLQNAEYVLTFKGQKVGATKRPGSGTVILTPTKTVSTSSQGESAELSAQSYHLFLADVDPDTIIRSIQKLFDSSKNMDDTAFHEFVSALCKLSIEMVEMQSGSVTQIESGSTESIAALSPATTVPEHAHRRHVSSLHLQHTLRVYDFTINKIGYISRLNIMRFTTRPPDVVWDVVMDHLISVTWNRAAPHSIRLQAARSLDDILLNIPRSTGSSGTSRKSVQRLLLGVLAKQAMPDPAAGKSATVVEIRKMGLETLHQILQSAGHTLLVGWKTIFEMLASVCETPFTAKEVTTAEQSLASTPAGSPRSLRSLSFGFPAPSEKSGAALVRVAFQSLTLLCDSLAMLSHDHLRICISTIGRFGRQADTNIALTAAGSLLWGISDFIQARRKDSEEEAEYNVLWMLLLAEVRGLCTDSRSEVRIGAIHTLFRTLQLYGETLNLETWDQCIWKVIFPLLESIADVTKHLPVVSSINSIVLGLSPEANHSWDESKTLAFQSLSSMFADFLLSKLLYLESFDRVWDMFVVYIQDSFAFDSAASCTAALRCLERVLNAALSAPVDMSAKAKDMWQRAWTSCVEMGEFVSRRTRPPHPGHVGEGTGTQPFDQESLLAFVGVLQSTRNLSRKGDTEWAIERLTRLMSILRDVLTYSDSPSYRPDIDMLTPVQAAVLQTIKDIDLSIHGSPSLIMRDLSELLTLPFVGPFDMRSSMRETTSVKERRVTFIAFTKSVMPLLLDTYLRFQGLRDIYCDRTLEIIFSAYAAPIKLKYECPPPSRTGNDTPLWKTATSCFLQIVNKCTQQLKNLGEDVPEGSIEGIWRQIIDVFRGGILADSPNIESMPLEEQDTEEMFDLSLIIALKNDIVPLIGDARVPDYVVIQLARALGQGSKLYMNDQVPSLESHGSSDFNAKHDIAFVRQGDYVGSTVDLPAVSRERFSYWCLDLLFFICSDTAEDEEDLRRRVAALSLPTLLHRCQMTLQSYLADEPFRGNYPFPRTREEELVYVLQKLLNLRLWPGTLYAALSPSPSNFCLEQPAIVTGLPLSAIFLETIRRSSKAHLFHLYGLICEIAFLSRKPPIAWSSVSPPYENESKIRSPVLQAEDASDGSKRYYGSDKELSGTLEELNARALASRCLREVGREMGLL